MEQSLVPPLPTVPEMPSNEQITEGSMRQWMHFVRNECATLRAGLEEVYGRHNALLGHTKRAFDVVHDRSANYNSVVDTKLNVVERYIMEADETITNMRQDASAVKQDAGMALQRHEALIKSICEEITE